MERGILQSPRVSQEPSHEPITVLHEDEFLVVVAKPSGLLSVETPGAEGRTVSQALQERGIRAQPVHRLDREVSGALLLAKDPQTRAALEELFRERAVTKRYWALALMGPKKDAGEIKFPILEQGARARVSAVGKPALTRYRVLARGLGANELEVELVTGRYNQIRLHFAHSGWPLVGDRKYGKFKQDPFRFARVALHSWRLELVHPRTRRDLSVEAPLPPELVELRRRAGLQG
jgi:23S rRNA pseudouridine1911/1915/1917 synthase